MNDLMDHITIGYDVLLFLIGVIAAIGLAVLIVVPALLGAFGITWLIDYAVDSQWPAKLRAKFTKGFQR